MSSLETYRHKRDFRKTPEPAGQVKPTPTGNIFVIQKHDASRLHYDFRLELRGVLKSWAVPKGPSLDPSEKRLAIQVEDHPISYSHFEGIIPEGQYGGGTVLLWDEGHWEPEGDAEAGLRQGKLAFTLYGKKLHGRWELIRIYSNRKGDENKVNWLLMKKRDDAARPLSEGNILEEEPDSVLTGRSLEQISEQQDQVWNSKEAPKDKQKARPKKIVKNENRPAKKEKSTQTARGKGSYAELLESLEHAGARKMPFPRDITLQLALLSCEVPNGRNWLHEIKYDGYRTLCEIQAGKARMISRRGLDWTYKFKSLAGEAARLPVRQAIFDGEVVALDEKGLSNFQDLQNALTEGKDAQLRYYIFDLLYLDGFDLRGAALEKRKEMLENVLLSRRGEESLINYSGHFAGNADKFYQEACKFGLEGIISKRADQPWCAGRSSDWQKIKCHLRQELVIGGYTDPSGARSGLGALLVGHYDDQGQFIYAGKVGTGFNEKTLRELRMKLAPLEQKNSPFIGPPPRAKTRSGVHWVRPELVAEFAFGNWTRENVLRHASFQGLCEDKGAREVVREKPLEISKGNGHDKSIKMTETKPQPGGLCPIKPTQKKGMKAKSGDVEIAGVRLSNPNKILFPEQGITKRELAEYYDHIRDWILPHLVRRPLTLVRCPQGSGSKCFYQKHLRDDLPDTLRGIPIKDKENKEPELYILLDDIAGLISLVQLGVLEIHPWGSREETLEQPDQITFDLDPGPDVTWEKVIEAALLLRQILKERGLISFLKTSGGKGLHIVAPLAPEKKWDEVKEFCKSIADECVRREPDKYIATMSKAKRGGKIFIDYLRNGRGATSVAAYSTRARSGAPVSAPIRWDELTSSLSPAQYTIQNVVSRLKRLKKDPWAEFFELKNKLA